MNRGLKVSKNPGDIIKDSMVIDPTLTQTEDMDMESQLLNDNVSTVARCPEITVGGRLSHFDRTGKYNFRQMGSGIDSRRLQIGVYSKTTFSRNKRNSCFSLSNSFNSKRNRQSFKQKNGMERVQKKDAMKGFYSTLFLVPKKNGEMCPVINLGPLNRYLVKKHFKMDTMTKVLQLVEKGD